MRIKRRRGSVGVETVMVLPVALVVILLSRMILEASLNRQEIGVYTRASTITAAEAESTLAADCAFDQDAFQGRVIVTQTPSVDCSRYRAEAGLQNAKPFWDTLEDAAKPVDWADFLRDVKPRDTLYDMRGAGDSTMTLTKPAFLAQQSPVTSEQTYLTPQGELWGHDIAQFAKGHDAVIWDELSRENTHLLFPNVFPSR